MPLVAVAAFAACAGPAFEAELSAGPVRAATTTSAPASTTTTRPTTLESLLGDAGYDAEDVLALVQSGAVRHTLTTAHSTTEVILAVPLRFDPAAERATIEHVEQLGRSGLVVAMDPFGTGPVPLSVRARETARHVVVYTDDLLPPWAGGFPSDESYGVTNWVSATFARSIIRIKGSTARLQAATANYVAAVEACQRVITVIPVELQSIAPRDYLARQEVFCNSLGFRIGAAQTGQRYRAGQIEIRVHTFPDQAFTALALDAFPEPPPTPAFTAL